jgi:PAS domain S-box-containing protein
LLREASPRIFEPAIIAALFLFSAGSLAAQELRPQYAYGLNLFIGLFNDLALLIVFAGLYGFLLERLSKASRWLRQAVLGLAFALFALGCMQVRIDIAPGVIVDQRNAVVILAGAFGGPLSALIAAAVAGAYRAYLGGSGIYGGLLGLCLSAIAGIAINRLRAKRDSAALMAIASVAAAVFIMPGFLPIGSWEAGLALVRRMFVPYGSAIAIGLFSGGLLLMNDERRRAAAVELKASARRYRELFESNIDMIHRSDKYGFLSLVSPACRTLLGYEPEEIIGKPANFFFSDPEGSRALLLQRINETGSIANLETEVVRKDGSMAVVSTNLKVVFDEKGAFAGIEGVSRDISQLKRAEDEKRQLEESLLQSRKMESVGHLAGGIAHDFNNILTAILGFSEIAKAKLKPDDPVQEDIEGIVTAGMRAKELVKHILLFSRKSSGKKTPVRIRLALRDSYSLMRASVPTTIDIKQEYGDVEGSVLAEATELHQVVMNLCTNAAQAMEEHGGVMTIGLARVVFGEAELADKPGLSPGPYFAVSVSDTGRGIAPDVMSRIFDPYFTTKEAGKGTGLGLSVVDGIVRSHGGIVTARSEPGIGSTFTAYFPQIDLPPEAARPSAALQRGTERILLVDDEESVVYVTSLRLQMLGYHIVQYSDSILALEAFRADPRGFDLVLTDKTMPSLSGRALARALRGIRPDIPIILCTGYASPSDGSKEDATDIDAVLLKPIAYNELAALVRRLLDPRRESPAS